MHTAIVIFGVVANIILVLGLISMIVGVIWIVSPLKDKVYMGSVFIYRYYNPLGGRGTGVVILGIGLVCLGLGYLLDEEHAKLARKFGSRI
jgi:hypothetical protein